MPVFVFVHLYIAMYVCTCLSVSVSLCLSIYLSYHHHFNARRPSSRQRCEKELEGRKERLCFIFRFHNCFPSLPAMKKAATSTSFSSFLLLSKLKLEYTEMLSWVMSLVSAEFDHSAATCYHSERVLVR